MIRDCMYIELKTGYSDDGPAWIGYVKTSKTRKTIYFNDHAFQKSIGSYSNYIDIENGDEYWISGLKKGESNRHWAGHGKIKIDRRAIAEYLALIGEKELPQNLFEVVEIEDRFPVERKTKATALRLFVAGRSSLCCVRQRIRILPNRWFLGMAVRHGCCPHR